MGKRMNLIGVVFSNQDGITIKPIPKDARGKGRKMLASKYWKPLTVYKPLDYDSIKSDPMFRVPEGDYKYDPKLYGERVKMMRQKRGITQKDLADFAGIPNYQSVQQIEAGMKKINLELVSFFAMKLRCSSYYLLGLTDYETNYPDEGGAMRTPAIIKSWEGEYITIKQIQEAYDKELVKLCLKMMKGTKELRKYYKESIKKMLRIKMK